MLRLISKRYSRPASEALLPALRRLVVAGSVAGASVLLAGCASTYDDSGLAYGHAGYGQPSPYLYMGTDYSAGWLPAPGPRYYYGTSHNRFRGHQGHYNKPRPSEASAHHRNRGSYGGTQNTKRRANQAGNTGGWRGR